MNRSPVVVLIVSILIIPSFLSGQNLFKGYEHLFTPVRNYVAYQTVSEIVIDGKGDEKSWEAAEWSAGFLDIEGDKKPKPLLNTQIKMLWDSCNLYILAELEEPHIWATYSNHDQIVYHENDFEVFIDPDMNAADYYEFEVNAKNTLFDLFLPKTYRDGGRAMISWDSPGFKSAVEIEGTLNNPNDTDKKWTVEMAIPFFDLRPGIHKQIPVDNQKWKIGFSRVEWQTESVDGVYRKKTDPETNRHYPEYNWVWSPPGLISMHYPERWGMVQFSTNPVDGKKVAFQPPADEKLRDYLWLGYYKQKQFKNKNGRFASLAELELPEKITTDSGEKITFEVVPSTYQFTFFVKSDDGTILSVDNNGNLRKSINNEN